MLALITLFASVAAVSPAPPVSGDEARLIGNMITARLGQETRLDVISAADVRRALEFEAGKQALGCSQDTCLVEIAGAMGADLVVYGDIGRLDDRVVLTVNLFDAKHGNAPGRAVVDAASVGALRDRLDAVAHSLLDGWYAAHAAEEGAPHTKVVVLDLQTAAPPPPEPQTASDLPLVPLIVGVAGGVAIVGGVIALGFSFTESQAALAAKTPQLDVAGHTSARDVSGVGGIAATVAGAGAIGVGAFLAFGGGAQ